MEPILDYGRVVPPPKPTWAQLKPVVIWASFLIPLEAGCAYLTYYTIGEVMSGLYYALVFLSLLIFALAFVHPRPALRCLIALAILIVPYQLFLGVRWWRVSREADRVAAYVQSTVSTTGTPPADLSRYRFRDRGARTFIGYSPNGGKAYRLDYWVSDPGTSYTYIPGTGWYYYPA
jgi:hypothetical protein